MLTGRSTEIGTLPRRADQVAARLPGILSAGLLVDANSATLMLLGSESENVWASALTPAGIREQAAPSDQKERDHLRNPGVAPESLVAGSSIIVGRASSGISLVKYSGRAKLSLDWSDKHIKMESAPEAAHLILRRSGDAAVVLSVPATHDPKIALMTGNRDRAVLGDTDLISERTGATESRPASSLVLFGPDGTVLEKLPR